MSRPYVPQVLLDAAHARVAARARGDFDEADRLRAVIEAAGWRVVDAGTNFRLEPAHIADIEADGIVRYGRSAAVPSRLGEAATVEATVVIVATEDMDQPELAIARLMEHLPAETQIVVVADGLPQVLDDRLHSLPGRVEVVRTAVRLGTGAAWNVGIRRAIGRIVVICDPSVEPAGDFVTPIVAALAHAEVAVAGPLGLASEDLHRYRPVQSGTATAIDGRVLGFRRTDAEKLGPVDERFREPAHLDAWWSLVLRDGVPEDPIRRALVTATLPIDPQEPASLPSANGREGPSERRNLYRLQDRFRGRTDLAVAGP